MHRRDPESSRGRGPVERKGHRVAGEQGPIPEGLFDPADDVLRQQADATAAAAEASFAARPNFEVFACAGLVMTAVTCGWREPWSGTVRRSGLILTVVAIVSLLLLSPIVATGSVGDFLDYVFVNKTAYVRLASLTYLAQLGAQVPVGLPSVPTALGGIFDAGVWLLPPLALGAAVVALARRSFDGRAALVAGFAALAVAARIPRPTDSCRPAREVHAAALRLREFSGGTPTFVLGSRAGFLYVTSGVSNPTPFDYPTVTSVGRFGEDRLIEAVTTGRISRACAEPPRSPEQELTRLRADIDAHLTPGPDLGPCQGYYRADAYGESR